MWGTSCRSIRPSGFQHGIDDWENFTAVAVMLTVKTRGQDRLHWPIGADVKFESPFCRCFDTFPFIVSFLRTIKAMWLYQVQFNIVSSNILRKASVEPENCRDLIVRVESFVSYFVSLTKEGQMDIINRIEHQGFRYKSNSISMFFKSGLRCNYLSPTTLRWHNQGRTVSRLGEWISAVTIPTHALVISTSEFIPLR
jgi:hypothetical protein